MGKRKRTWPYLVLFNTHIRGTFLKSHIYLKEVTVRKIPKPLFIILSKKYVNLSPTVKIHSKVLKHIYDDHPSHAIDIIKHIAAMVGSPDAMFENKIDRTGLYMSTLQVESRTYGTIFDVIQIEGKYSLYIRTAFYISKPRLYLGGLKCIWMNVSRFVEPGGQHTPPS